MEWRSAIAVIIAVVSSGGIAQERDYSGQALRELREVRRQAPRADYAGPIFELNLLGKIPGLTNPKLESLALIDGPLNVPWPPHLDELKEMLRKEMTPQRSLNLKPEWLLHVHQLLRVEHRLRTTLGKDEGYEKVRQLELERTTLALQGGKAARVQELDAEIARRRAKLDEKRKDALRAIAGEDLDYLLHAGSKPNGPSNFESARIYFPPSLAATIRAAAPKILREDKVTGQLYVPAKEARELLAKPFPPKDLVAISSAISQGVRRQLPPQLNYQRDAERMLSAIQRKEAASPEANGAPAVVPKVNKFSIASGPTCPGGGTLSDDLAPYYRLTPNPEENPAAAANTGSACFVDNNRLENQRAAQVGHDANAELLREQGGQDSFQLTLHTVHGESEGKVGECMSSIVNPAAYASAPAAPGNLFPPAPGHDGAYRVVLLTASHCLHGDLTSLDIPGFAEGVSTSHMRITRIPNSDASVVTMDVPAETALLLTQAQDHLVYPPNPQLNVNQLEVVADVNVGADHSRRNLGSTFAVGNNQVGLNFKHFGNQGIFPGDSGGGVFAMVAGPDGSLHKTWLGAMSYKCLDPRFGDSVGAMASGADVFAAVNAELQDAALPIYDSREFAMHHPREDHPAALEPAHTGSL